MLCYCDMVSWAWLDWGLSVWLTTLLQCFDTVGWVVRPVKHRLRNDLNGVEWDVKPCSINQSSHREQIKWLKMSDLWRNIIIIQCYLKQWKESSRNSTVVGDAEYLWTSGMCHCWPNWSGTLCPMTYGMRMFLRTATDSHWRRFYLRSTSVFSALEVFFTRMNPHLTLTFLMTLFVSVVLRNVLSQQQTLQRVAFLIVQRAKKSAVSQAPMDLTLTLRYLCCACRWLSWYIRQ